MVEAARQLLTFGVQPPPDIHYLGHKDVTEEGE
jgi:hypothetical protein